MPAPTPLNIYQVFSLNPITTNASTDLMYFGQSPYGMADDAAMTFANFAAQFMLAGTGVVPAQVQDQAFTSAVAVGGPTVYSMTLSPAPSAYVEGQLFTFRCPLDNTGASTMNVNTLGAKGIYTAGGNALVGGEMFGGSTYLIEYNGAINAFMLINPSNYTTVPQVQQSAFNYSTNDFGAANAYVVALSPHLASYTDGLQISFKAANANTTASTIKEGSLSAVPIVTDANAALSGGEILADGIYDVVYNSTFSAFVLLNSSASGGGGATGTQIQEQAFTYAVDSGIADAYVVSYTPAITSLTDGLALWFQPTNTNATNNPTIAVNGLSAVTIVCESIGSTPPGALIANNDYLIIYNVFNSNFNLINPDLVAFANYVYTYASKRDVATQDLTYSSDTGSANAYVTSAAWYAPIPIPNALTVGSTLTFKAANTNTTASTMTVNGSISAFPIEKNSALGPTALIGGEIISGNMYTCVLIAAGASPVFILMNPT